MSIEDRKTRMAMITVPAGTCGTTLAEARKLQDRIVSALTRWLRAKDYTLDLLSGVSDIDIDKGQYIDMRNGLRGRPVREQIITPGRECIPDPDPHIHIILSCCPGATIINKLLEIINARIPDGNKANLQDISEVWDDRKNYVEMQSRYFRVVEQGDPSILPHGRWQFARFGRGKVAS